VKPARWIFVLISLMIVGLAQAQSNPVPLINQPLVPDATAPGGPSFTLTVNGTGFVSGATVNWNGIALTTTFVSSSQLTATVPAANVASAGTAEIKVLAPGAGQAASNVVFFPVATPESNMYLSMSSVKVDLKENPTVLEGDFNSDGIPDVIAADQDDGALSIVFGKGDATFQPPLPIVPGAGYEPILASTGDFNNDGNLDFLINDPSIILQVLLGNGSGGFTPVNKDLSSFTSVLRGVLQGDFNGDGKLDVACYCGNVTAAYAIEVLRGNGDGTFQSPIQSPTASVLNGFPGPYLAPGVTGDFNGDGRLDLVVMGGYGIQGYSGVAQILLGNGDGTFSQGTVYNVGEIPSFAIAADFNGDGKLDLAIADTYTYGLTGGGDLVVMLGNGDGTFTGGSGYQFTGVGGFPESMAVGDFNGDGKLDLAVMVGCPLCGTVPVMFYGNGDGTFQESAATVVNLNGTFFPALMSSVAGDFNRDGRLDFVAGLAGSRSVILLTQVSSATLSPTSLTFGPQAINTTSPAQTVTLQNFGTATLTISSIGFTGANPGDYAQTNNCGTSLAINASCQINVNFTPIAPGARDAFLSVADNATFSPQTVTLQGNVPVPVPPQFSLTTLTFSQLPIGSTSPQQAVTVTNVGQSALSITRITVARANLTDFFQTNNCGSSLAAQASCRIEVTFRPTADGPRSAAISVSDNASGSPQTVSLSGSGPDFSVTPSGPASATVTAGQTAIYDIAVSPSAGFSQVVQLFCSGVPAGAVCMFPSSVTLTGSGPTPVRVTVTTVGSSAILRWPAGPGRSKVAALLLAFTGLPGLAVLGSMGWTRKRRVRAKCGFAVLCLLCLVTWTACGGGSGSAGATTSGITYNINFTGNYVDGAIALKHTTKLTLVVQ
jgi:FG-GAP-like repeat/Abnormal spindle-like microcephaly-assoc'd, ASPM-SPD-2-Hydin